MAKSTGNPPATPGDAFVARLERLFAVIVEHVRNSPEFASRVEHTLGERPAPAPQHRPAALDPFALYDQGWEAMLNQELARLDADQLRDVIHQYDLDPRGASAREKTADRLRDRIVKAVLARTG